MLGTTGGAGGPRIVRFFQKNGTIRGFFLPNPRFVQPDKPRKGKIENGTNRGKVKKRMGQTEER